MASQIDFIQSLQSKEIAQIQSLVGELSSQQQLWLSGYLAGIAANANPQSSSLPESQSHEALTVLYASQTGNCKRIAEAYHEKAQNLGLVSKLQSMSDFKENKISSIKYLALIISTHGEGDPPDDAELFYEFLFSTKVKQLDQLQYTVLALGDSSYTHFCKTGKDIDEQLKKLGATQISPRVDCDLDYEDVAEKWQSDSLDEFKSLTAEEKDGLKSNLLHLNSLPDNTSSSKAYSKDRPFQSEVLRIQRLTAEPSVKNVYHLELSLENSSIKYKPGDSLGVIVDNNDVLVDSLMAQLGASKESKVNYKNEGVLLTELLTKTLEITLLDRPFLTYYSELSNSRELQKILSSQASFESFVTTRQLINVLKEYPTEISPQDLVDNLRKKTPRLYSISSSQLSVLDEVHLTVDLLQQSSNGINLLGLTSGQLCQHVKEGDQVRVYHEENANFRLPENPDTPIIMIGPGTGIAPFRSFLQEREELRSAGKNWLFFGNPNFETDFLYQTELLRYLDTGLLSKLDVAFSRDQPEKIYVQHRLREHRAELWSWIKGGAFLYVCGDAKGMSVAVESVLLEMFQEMDDLSMSQAVDYLKQMKRERRYQKDVY